MGSWYFQGCCGAAGAKPSTPTPTPTPTYTYASGVVTDPTQGGTGTPAVSPAQSLAYNASSTLAFTGQFDDLCLMIPTSGATVSASYDSGTTTTTATLPASAVILAPNDQSMTTRMVVTDGTHTATIPAGTAAGSVGAILSAGGFTVVAANSIPISTLTSKGMTSGGNVVWKFAVVPSGGGQINVTGATLS